MRKAITAFLLCLTGVASTLPMSAAANVADFFGCCMDGCWEVGAEALWWKPCTCTFNYGTLQNAGNTRQSVLALNQDYDWGFRIYTGYRSECDCYFVRLGWTYLDATDSVTTYAQPGQAMRLIFCAPDLNHDVSNAPYYRATASQKIIYNKINLRAGKYLHEGCAADFYAYGGLRYIDIEQTRRLKGIVLNNGAVENVTATDHERSTFDGLGFELGFGGEYHLGCSFNLVGHLGAVVLLGHQRLHCSGFFPPVNTITQQVAVIAKGDRPSSTTCVPGVELRLGLSYAYECNCIEIIGEIGYELDYYYRIYSVVGRATQTGSTAFPAHWENVGFGGPYIGASICF